MHNPYREEPEAKIQTATDLFGNFRVVPVKKHQSERGELLRYFSQKTNQPIVRIAVKLEGLNLTDLYYIKSSCDQYEKSGNPWGKAFHGMLKVIHTP